MAKFCSQCGRKLEDGEVCNCTSGQAPATNQSIQGQPEVNQAVPEQLVQPTVNQAMQGQFVNSQQTNANPLNKEVENVVSDLVGLMKQPVVKLAEIAQEKKGMIFGGCFVSINILVCTLIAIFYMLYLHNKVADYQIYLPGIPYVQIPLFILIFTAASAALLATFLFLFDNQVFHGNATFGSMLMVVGAKAIVAAVFFMFGFIISLLNAGIGLVFWIMGIMVAYAYMAIGYSQISILDANKKAFVLMIVTIIMTVINCVFVRIIIGTFMESISDYIYTLMGLF